MQYQITAISVEHSAEISDDDTNTVESLYKPRLLLLRTIISSISLIVMGTPLFFHPYIEKTLTSLLVLQQIKSIPDFAAVNEDITKCLTILATTVPPRLSIPVLLKATPALMKSGHSQAYYFVQLVKIIYTNLDRQTIVAHMQSLIVIATLLLDYHRVYGDRSELSMTISTISSEAIIELLLKFTETELKSFLLKLSEWRDIFIANIISVFKVDSSNSNVIGNKRKDVDYDISISDVDSWQVFARSSSFYSILKLLSDRLQELFTPIMGLFWINASELLAITIHLTYNINIGNNANAVANIDDSSKKKKKKITEGSSVIDTTKVVDVCTELTIVAANIMDCVRSCCDNDASSFLDQVIHDTFLFLSFLFTY